MTDLQKEFEATGYTSWINADLYPDGKIYTQEYTQWLEKQVLQLRKSNIIKAKQPPSLRLRELRDRFFEECTDSDIKVNMAPHDLFEWFMRNVPKPSLPTEDEKRKFTFNDMVEAFNDGVVHGCNPESTHEDEKAWINSLKHRERRGK